MSTVKYHPDCQQNGAVIEIVWAYSECDPGQILEQDSDIILM